jgi:hypothetical protein
MSMLVAKAIHLTLQSNILKAHLHSPMCTGLLVRYDRLIDHRGWFYTRRPDEMVNTKRCSSTDILFDDLYALRSSNPAAASAGSHVLLGIIRRLGVPTKIELGDTPWGSPNPSGSIVETRLLTES